MAVQLRCRMPQIESIPARLWHCVDIRRLGRQLAAKLDARSTAIAGEQRLTSHGGPAAPRDREQVKQISFPRRDSVTIRKSQRVLVRPTRKRLPWPARLNHPTAASHLAAARLSSIRPPASASAAHTCGTQRAPNPQCKGEYFLPAATKSAPQASSAAVTQPRLNEPRSPKKHSGCRSGSGTAQSDFRQRKTPQHDAREHPVDDR